MDKANKEIRDRIRESGIFYWQVAAELHINDGNFSRRLRHELSQEEKETVIQAIERIVSEEEKG